MDHLATSLETCTKSMGVPKITIHTELKSEHTELTNKKIISPLQKKKPTGLWLWCGVGYKSNTPDTAGER